MATSTLKISDPLTQHVQDHYDRISKLYQMLWGDHIHHGYWEADESVEVAQTKLISKLEELAGIKPGSRVLDVGCGVGGSSVWLAQNLKCKVTGLTLSPVQAKIATERARKLKVSDDVNFSAADANHLDVADNTYDVVWAIESTEHFNNKPEFIQKAFRTLKPGGVLTICAWLDGHTDDAGKNLVADICDRMICPSLGRLEEYQQWMKNSGFENIEGRDVTSHVKKTWDLCVKIINRMDVKLLIRALDERSQRFTESFVMMQQAFETGAMGYGMFAARKPQ